MCVALHHLPKFQSCASADEAWDALAGVFTAKLKARRLQLTQELALFQINPEKTSYAYSGGQEATSGDRGHGPST